MNYNKNFKSQSYCEVLSKKQFLIVLVFRSNSGTFLHFEIYKNY
jgi:hypothetical protein